MKLSHFLLIAMFSLSWNAAAQTPVLKSFDWQMGVGSGYIYDDYLSPLPYQGNSLLFSCGTTKPLNWSIPDSLSLPFKEAKWSNQVQFSLNTVYGKSPAGSRLLHGNVDFRDNLMRQLIDQQNWSVSLGGFLALGGGGRYCLVNGNNPASLDVYLDLGITGLTDYRFNLWNKPMKLSYQGSFSLSGIAFSPEYAESYYEIFYLGNKENVLKYTQPFNNEHWRQLLSLQIPLSKRKSSLRLNIQNDGHITLYNNIRTRVMTTHFSVGYIRYFNIL